MKLAVDIWERREAKGIDFDSEVKDKDLIINLDVSEMREGLIKGTFTSVDLVNVFGDRCKRIGRSLYLSAEENFQ